MLLDAWEPLFAVGMGIPRAQMETLSVPVLVDYADWHNEREAAHRGGQ